MSVLQERVVKDLKESMKKGERRRRDVLRMLRAEFLREEIALMKKDEGLAEEDAQRVLSRELRKREEAALAFRSGKAEGRAQEEDAEAAILRAYMPSQLSDAELDVFVQEVIQRIGAATQKDMGTAMKEIMGKVAGRASGARVRDMVAKKINQ